MSPDEDPQATVSYTVVDCPDGEGGMFFIEESALIELLADDILFVGAQGQSSKNPLELFVNCNELFYYAADAEPLPFDQLEPLYRAWKAKGGRGVAIWACHRRGMRPLPHVEQRWRDDGDWNDALERLPPREYPG